MVDRRYVGRTLKQFVREFKQLKVHPHFEAANHTRPKAMGAAANESIPGEVHTPQSADIEEDEDDISIDSEGEELPHPIYGSPSPAPEETSLDAAINDLSNESRTSLLQDICREIKGAEALTSSRLLAPIEGSTAKRKAYETCKHCRQEYAVIQNHNKACRYHPG